MLAALRVTSDGRQRNLRSLQVGCSKIIETGDFREWEDAYVLTPLRH